MNPQNFIKYYQQCFLGDASNTVVHDVFHKSILFRHCLPGPDEVIQGEVPAVPLELEYGEALFGKVQTHFREFDLVYAHLMLVGFLGEGEKQEFLSAPLLLHEASLEMIDGVRFLRPNFNRRTLNHELLRQLPDILEGQQSMTDALWTAVGNDTLNNTSLSAAMTVFETRLRHVNTEAMVDWPQVLDEEALKKARTRIKRAKKHDLHLLPVSLAYLMPKSKELRGLMTELQELVQNPDYSQPLRVLLGEPYPDEQAPKAYSHQVPAVLSESQVTALENAVNQTLSMVVGPPGTGKSFTIAAMALDHAARGERVLIASKMVHAVNVVKEKIDEMSGVPMLAMRGGHRQDQENLKRYLEDLLSGYAQNIKSIERKLAETEGVLNTNHESLELLRDRLPKYISDERLQGNKLAEPPTIWRRVRNRYIKFKYKGTEALWTLFEHFHQAIEYHQTLSKGKLALQHELRTGNATRKYRRASYRAFLNSLKARTGKRQKELFEQIDFDHFFQTFPIWLSTLGGLSRVLPFQKEAFDLLIIDEATQCDVAVCLPAIQRAKRVVILGDHKQLRHISFLSRDRQVAFQKRFDLLDADPVALDYRNTSLLDLVDNRIDRQESVSFLDEHYRSDPAIIGFSNQAFYRKRLRVMTQLWDLDPHDAFEVYSVQGERKEGINQAEVEALMDRLREIVAADAGNPKPVQIGILSPFRAQVDELRNKTFWAIGYQAYTHHNVLIGTAHTFQGEERDIMLLSLCIDDNSHGTSLRFLENENVFNVSITRARKRMIIYYSLSLDKLPPDSLVGRYLSYIQNLGKGKEIAPVKQGQDEFAEDVRKALSHAKGEVFQNWEIAGTTLDLLLRRNGKMLGIDLIGYPGAMDEALPLERYLILERLGLRLFPLPYRQWVHNREACLRAIRKMF